VQILEILHKVIYHHAFSMPIQVMLSEACTTPLDDSFGDQERERYHITFAYPFHIILVLQYTKTAHTSIAALARGKRGMMEEVLVHYLRNCNQH
jgi:hypothetical protein